MPWQQLFIETSREKSDLISELLESHGASAVTLQDAADHPLFEPPPGATPLWEHIQIIGLFPADHDMTGVLAALKLILSAEDHYRLETLADQPWERTWLDDFKPMHFGGDLWICPTHSEPPYPEAVNIRLDPGLAFGTGTHPTTAQCLRWLATHPPIHQTVMDFGCGSGILAIAALKLGAERVFAIDHDPQALIATEQNAKNNEIAMKQLTLTADLISLKGINISLILANILANPLMMLAPQFVEWLSPNGVIVLAGILLTQKAEVLKAYEPWFHLVSEAEEDGWCCLVMKVKNKVV